MKFILSALLTLAMTAPAPAQRSGDRGTSEGVFDVRVRVDGEAFLYVKGTDVTDLVVSGNPLRMERTTYTEAIPRAVFGRFDLEKVDGRGDVELFEAPMLSNDYTAVIRINDRNGGPDDYHLRLSWT